MGEVGQQTSLVALERAGGVDDRLETGVGGPEVPAPPVALGPSSALVLPEVAHALLDGPLPWRSSSPYRVGRRSAPGGAWAGSLVRTATDTSSRRGTCHLRP